MGTRNVRSGRKALLLAATASAAATAAGSNAARGGLMVDLRITGIDGQPVPLSQSKSLYAGIGDVVAMAVYAQVSGTNGLNDETVDIVGGSFTSGQGGLLGNLSSTVTAPFGSPGYTNGNQADFDSDGDLDVGSIGTTATNKMAARVRRKSVPPAPPRTRASGGNRRSRGSSRSATRRWANPSAAAACRRGF
jgi:hypothetical protein